ncbi:MAG: OmpA family protein, partial [Gammaproteobacteria bacterium]|nr:OmpA family protein [Gammaproteobacteria bacterium]
MRLENIYQLVAWKVLIMTNSQNPIHADLPWKMWWLITLSGLVLLFVLMILSRQEIIETDLEYRIMEKLSVEKIDWVTIELDGRGRDVLLKGMAPSAESRQLVIEMVESVYGVRVIDDQLEIRPSLSSSELSIQQQDGAVVLGGRLASQASIDTVVNAAKATFGNENVVNELILSAQVKTADWLDATTQLLPSLVNMGTAQLKISDSDSLLTAEVESHGERLMLVYEAKKLLGSNLDTEVAVTGSAAPGTVQENTADLKAVVAQEDPALKDCQSRLDAGIKGKKVLFASNTAELQATSYPILDQIISTLEQCDEVVSENKLIIAGHTDNSGDEAYNLALSQRRADAVKAYIVN